MAIGRVVQPELLDNLPPEDPKARRSRRDLRFINALMGNFPWIRRRLHGFPRQAAQGVVEIGAGEGRLCRYLQMTIPQLTLAGVDLAPRPPGLPAQIGWKQADILASLPAFQASALVGTMIVHHFSDESLSQLGPFLERFQLICLCEPWRSPWAKVLGSTMFPLVGSVTRHDMMVSIDAGFQPGELARLLNLHDWQIRESIDWRGSLRLVAWKE